ncbi:MAG: TRAP transporter large permease subunit [Pilosibacter sp.]
MAALLFISFIVLLLIGVPVAFAIAAAALLVLLKGDVKLLILVQRMFASTDSFSLIAVPFFHLCRRPSRKGKSFQGAR